ncbi:MAG: 16S rRNA (adenine(1518)-N(6)/adenine(1519)-N(6))-dimethyltransferase RsmA [Desulfobulbaceae bacterium]|nr:16S rRNA (adenine(1518)-N(6)/adenine(1519)-N(6))-dimethyltransferase RsmA [Desulfobulbaceae bacterium]
MVYQKTRSVLNHQKLAPKKKLGQNFLVHRHTAQRIVDLAGVEAGDTIIEVGVGLGALTVPMAERAERVIGIEADSGIIRLHREENDLPANVELIHNDILKADFKELFKLCGGKIKLVANLPYSISTPFLFRLVENHHLMHKAVVMLQREVAERIIAPPATKEYGVPSVLLASCAVSKLLLHVKPAEFHPRPKVDSTVLELLFEPTPKRVSDLGGFDRQLLRKIVNAGFGQRRKTLLNSLGSSNLVPDKGVLAELIEQCGFSPSIRAEKLRLEDFVTLTNVIGRHLAGSVSTCPPDRAKD